jgi:hypothetical protein
MQKLYPLTFLVKGSGLVFAQVRTFSSPGISAFSDHLVDPRRGFLQTLFLPVEQRYRLAKNLITTCIIFAGIVTVLVSRQPMLFSME